MIFVLAPSSALNKTLFELRVVPKIILDRGITVIPRKPLASRVFWRMLAEHQLTRYMVALAPFPALLVAFPDMALAISQAPLAMFLLIWLIETQVLAIPKEKRARIANEAEIARGRDALAARSRNALTRLAAEVALPDATLHLVVEQSALARVAPFTLVSVQVIEPEKRYFLDLDPAQRDGIAATLFDAEFTERDPFKHLTIVTASEKKQGSTHEVFFCEGPTGITARSAMSSRARVCSVSPPGPSATT